jgi:hypothetical protein
VEEVEKWKEVEEVEVSKLASQEVEKSASGAG